MQDSFINRLACDELQNANFRALIEGQNYMSSGWIGQILHAIADQLIRLKCVVMFSQAVNSYHNVSVTIQREDGTILECVCVTAWPAEGSVVAIQQDYCTKLKMQQHEGSQAWPANTACSSQHN